MIGEYQKKLDEIDSEIQYLKRQELGVEIQNIVKVEITRALEANSYKSDVKVNDAGLNNFSHNSWLEGENLRLRLKILELQKEIFILTPQVRKKK